MRLSVCIALMICYVAHYSEGAFQSTSKLLYDEVMTNYNADVRPVKNDSTTVVVDVKLIVSGLVQFDEIAQSLWTSAWIDISWTDELISWNISDFDGIKQISVPPNKIWTPDVTLANFHEEMTPLIETGIKADVHSDGQVKWKPGGVLKSRCEIDTTLIPFDIQTCELKFKVWSYNKDKVLLNALVKDKTVQVHGEWDPLSVDCSPLNLKGNDSIIYQILLQRLPNYILVNTVAPVILLSMINLLVFKIPAVAGERLSFAITTLLSFAVFLSYMSSFLPRNGSQVCYLSVYILTLLTQSALITASVIMSLYVRYDGDKKALYFKNLISKSKDRKGIKVNAINNTEKLSTGDGTTNEKSDQSNKDDVGITPNAREVCANEIDRFFFRFYFVTFLIITVVFTVILFASKVNGSELIDKSASCRTS